MTCYGHGATHIDLNGPHGTMTSLIRIGDYWATLLGLDRITVALALADWQKTPEQRYEAFARFFGDYSTLTEGSAPHATDPFSTWPFELRRPLTQDRFPTMPESLKALYDACTQSGAQSGAQSEEVAEWIAERLEFETEIVAYVLETYVKYATK
jgi:hypothetical protein